MNSLPRLVTLCVLLSLGLITFTSPASAYPVHRHAYSSVQSSYNPENLVLGLRHDKARNHRSNRPGEARGVVKKLAFVTHSQTGAGRREKSDGPEAIVRRHSASVPISIKRVPVEDEPSLLAPVKASEQDAPVISPKKSEPTLLSKPETTPPAAEADHGTLPKEQQPVAVDLRKREEQTQASQPEPPGSLENKPVLGQSERDVGKILCDASNVTTPSGSANRGLSGRARLLLSVIYFGSFFLFVLLSCWWLSSVRKDEASRSSR